MTARADTDAFDTLVYMINDLSTGVKLVKTFGENETLSDSARDFLETAILTKNNLIESVLQGMRSDIVELSKTHDGILLAALLFRRSIITENEKQEARHEQTR